MDAHLAPAGYQMTSFHDLEPLFSKLVKANYVAQGLQNCDARELLLRNLLTHRKLPKDGLNDQIIEYIVNQLSFMDSNNFISNIGVGEREGRVYSSLVKKRNCNLSHGIGRSGDIAEVQPKAAGSSLIYKLATSLVSHAMILSGLNCGANCLILPMATGMSLGMCLLSLKASNPTAKYVIWPRIDQKSCFKAIVMAGLIPLVVENIVEQDELFTDVHEVERLLQLHGSDVLCVLCTTSCFAPRQPDSVDKVAALCKKFSTGHLINNAYGLQCEYISKLINRAATIGRVDAGNNIPLLSISTINALSFCISLLLLIIHAPIRTLQWYRVPTKTLWCL